MSFLTPWFLLGALAIGGPILFHLIRRATRDRMPFSSLMFLSPTAPRVARRRKVEHFWLLLLRCLCLLLLALGFARPFFAREMALPPAAGDPRQLVLLLDTSASMRREGVWDQARATADRYLAKAAPGDQVAVVTFDRQPRTHFGFTEWSSWRMDQRASLARQRLGTLSPGWMASHLGLALTRAAELLVEDGAQATGTRRRELVLITDLQEGARLDGLQGHEWPAEVQIVVERVDARAQSNAGLEIVRDSGPAPQGGTQEVRVRVTNARDSRQEKFTLSWAGQGQTVSTNGPVDIYLPPGQTRTFTAPRLPAGITSGQLELAGDEAGFDNRSYFAAPETEQVLIAMFGSDSANDPQKLRYYLQRAFPGTAGKKVEIVSPALQNTFSPERLNQAVFAVIPGRLTTEEAAATRGWLERGKTALLVLTDLESLPTLTALTDLPGIQISEGGGEYALLGQIDFAHPIFAPFADPRFSDFTRIHFWKHRRLELPATTNAQVLARFDDGSPALTRLAVGRGNLLVLASGWHPGDSQLAVASKFPPLLQTMVEWSGASLPARFQFATGDLIPAPAIAEAAVEWVKPDGKKETLTGGQPFAGTDQPGLYTMTYNGKTRRFAVNLPLEESRTAPASLDELARLGLPMKSTVRNSSANSAVRRQHLQQAELENRQKLWRWLIVGVLGVTCSEIFLSGWLARRSAAAEVAT